MRCILPLLLLVLILPVGVAAQDCSELATEDTMLVCREQYYDLLIQGKYDEWYNADGSSREKVTRGYEMELHKRNDNGDEIRYTFYPIRERNRLYLSLLVTYPYFACKLLKTKNRYEIKFADGTLYKYDQSYSATCADDFYILLYGMARELHWDLDEKKVTSVTPFYGDTVLLKKMQQVPVQKLTKYAANRNNAYWQKQTGKVYEDYEIEHELILPKAEAIKLMHSLQCLSAKQ